MGKNHLSMEDQRDIDEKLNYILLSLHKSYPEDSLLDIVKSAIPNVKILEDTFDGDHSIRGVIFKQSKEFKTPVIAIQKNLSPEAKTFTLAHEFAHYMLDHPGTANYLFDKIVYDGSEEKQRESAAQYFAASLLMPKDKFLWLDRVVDDQALAKRFGVSVAAVRVRRDWLQANGRKSQ